VKTVLVIDDSATMRALVCAALREKNLFDRYVEASDGAAGLRAAADVTPDLVLCDLVMPGVDGYGFLERFRATEVGARVPVLMLSSEQEAAKKVGGLERGANDYIVKPCPPAELCARVANYLRMKSLQDELEAKNRELSVKNAELATMAITDSLTQLHNRRHFIERGEQEFARAARAGAPLGLLLCDVDHFKQVNDSYGHHAGDRVLQEVARLVRDAVRQGDVVARWGGEEFVVLLPDADYGASMRVAEKLRTVVESKAFSGTGAPITISIGVGGYPAPGVDSLFSLIEIADQALYRAKQAGRNRTESLRPASV
jgi:diguanylate cyclase (GGDEF)-like protein